MTVDHHLPAPNDEPSSTGLVALLDLGVPEALRASLVRLGWFILTPSDMAPEALPALRPAVALAPIDQLEAALRSCQRMTATVPLFAVSNSSGLGPRLDALRAGASGFVALPASDGDVMRLLDTAINPPPPPRERRILLVDDDPVVASLYGGWLEHAGYQVHSVETGEEGFAALDRVRPEAMLIDLSLPDCSGDELAAIIRQHPDRAAMPILFLSGERRPARQGQALRCGGDAFIVKPVDRDALLGHVAAALARQVQLLSLIARDPLTGLLNPVAFRRDLQQLTALAARTGRPLSLAMIDIDHFKAVNDTYGHPVGDRVLRRLAHHISGSLRRSDVAGRLGGEEFAVILPSTPPSAARHAIDDLRRSFTALVEANHHGDEPVTISFSGGIAGWDGTESLDQLLARADRALYAAKHAGRNRVEVASP
ncbi:MAG: diguanylate cyclase [Alphaproteobacteria bacterium]|nr:MAG: diguanylate cyclase [Alphaproteobacteria bacterium]